MDKIKIIKELIIKNNLDVDLNLYDLNKTILDKNINYFFLIPKDEVIKNYNNEFYQKWTKREIYRKCECTCFISGIKFYSGSGYGNFIKFPLIKLFIKCSHCNKFFEKDNVADIAKDIQNNNLNNKFCSKSCQVLGCNVIQKAQNYWSEHPEKSRLENAHLYLEEHPDIRRKTGTKMMYQKKEFFKKFYNELNIDLTFDSKEKEEKIDKIIFDKISGVWAIWNKETNECLQVGQNKDIFKELRREIRLFKKYGIENFPKDHEDSYYWHELGNLMYNNMLEFRIIAKNINFNDRLLIELKYAKLHNAKYWKPQLEQIKLLKEIN